MQLDLDGDPLAQARDAISKGDFRFLAISSYSFFFPGLTDDQLVSVYGYYLIPGITGSYSTVAEESLASKAYGFSKVYNHAIFKYLIGLCT